MSNLQLCHLICRGDKSLKQKFWAFTTQFDRLQNKYIDMRCGMRIAKNWVILGVAWFWKKSTTTCYWRKSVKINPYLFRGNILLILNYWRNSIRTSSTGRLYLKTLTRWRVGQWATHSRSGWMDSPGGPNDLHLARQLPGTWAMRSEYHGSWRLSDKKGTRIFRHRQRPTRFARIPRRLPQRKPLLRSTTPPLF